MSDSIHVGDQYEWSPYGTEGWPHAHCFCEVVDVVDNGEDILIYTVRVDSNGEALNDDRPSYNTESHFREMTRLYRRPTAINEFEPGKYSTDKPRKIESNQ